jgi:hypothetical protein
VTMSAFDTACAMAALRWVGVRSGSRRAAALATSSFRPASRRYGGTQAPESLSNCLFSSFAAAATKLSGEQVERGSGEAILLSPLFYRSVGTRSITPHQTQRSAARPLSSSRCWFGIASVSDPHISVLHSLPTIPAESWRSFASA